MSNPLKYWTVKPLPLLVLLLLLSFLLPVSCATSQETVLVTNVIDGDTIVLQGGERLRYIGMDTPEVGRAYYQEAKEANKALVLGKRVRLEKDLSDKDRYGRLLRYVYVNGTFVNGELVRMGMARAKAYRPDVKYQAKLEALEREAVLAGRGIWLLERSRSGVR